MKNPIPSFLRNAAVSSMTLLVLIGTGQAVERAADFSEAREIADATDFDTAVFLYGSDWSRAGRELKENVWDSETLADSLGDEFVLLAVDHPEGIEKRERDKKMKELSGTISHSDARMGEVVCAMGTTLVKQDDRSVLCAKETNPLTEIHSFGLRIPEGGADTIILEFLPDASLPHGGPGRATNGNFVINEIDAAIGTNPIRFDGAWADHLYKQAEGPWKVIDGQAEPANYWNVGTHNRHERVRLFLIPKEALPGGAVLKMKIHAVSPHKNHTPGRFGATSAVNRELAELIRIQNDEQRTGSRNHGLPCSSMNYPALFLLDSKGRLVGQKHGLNLKDNVDTFATWIKKTSAMRKERDQVWEVAKKIDGPAKAKLLERGLNLMRLGFGPGNVYKPVFEEIKKADPEDTSFITRKYTFNAGIIAKVAARLAAEESPEAGDAHYKEAFNHPGNELLSAGQLQSLYFAQYGFYKSQPAFKARVNEPLEKLAELDPMSPLGYGSAGKVLMSSGPPSVRFGWAERHTETHPATLEIGASMESLYVHFPEAGDYEVTLRWARGGELEITSLTMLAGTKEIIATGSPAVLSTKERVAQLTLKMPLIDPKEPLVMRIVCHGDKPSGGTIGISPVKSPSPEPTPSGRDGRALVKWQESLKSKLTGLAGSPDELAKLTLDPDYTHMLTKHEVLRLANAEKLAAIIATKDGETFLDRFFDDQEWMMMWLTCGPHSGDPAAELKHLSNLLAHDPSIAIDLVFKRLATAIAVAAGGSISRYDYFKESHDLGRLHRMFYEHPAWAMRFTLGIGEADGRFLRDAYNKPIHTYGNIHYQADYRLHSIFGDSIHGPHFYRPWQGLPRMQQIKYAGGVCGSLTTLGENIYKALGIPAQGMGEPGHRSYVVRTTPGHWSLRYSLSHPKRTKSFYGGLYEDLGTMEKVWADLDALRSASVHLWQARLHSDSAAKEPTVNPFQQAAYALALKTHPVYIDAWNEWIDALKKDTKTPTTQWAGMTKALLGKTTPLGEKVVFNLWRRFEANAIAGQKPSEIIDTHMATLAEFQQAYPAGFHHLHNLLQVQAGHLAKDPASTGSFFTSVMKSHGGEKFNTPKLTSWCVELAGKYPEEIPKYVAVLARELKLSDPETDVALKRSAFTQLLTVARNKKAFAAYHEIARMADKALPLDVPAERYLNAKQLETYPKVSPFRGKLLSNEGLITPWQPAKYDKILQHHRLLDDRGGYVHTNPHKDAWVMLELPRPARMSGIIITNRYEGAAPDQVPLKVAVSADGKKWTEVFTSDEPLPQWRIDLSNNTAEARFMKVFTKREKAAYFQLRNVLVYGEWVAGT